MDVVVVESPTKAKTIAKYLGDGFQVLASYGHVRDLPESEGSVVPDEDFLMYWEPLKKRGDPIGDIAKALKGADHLYLATDPDREGEAISWHLFSILDERGVIKDIDVKRVVFNEVTKRAVEHAIAHARGLDDNLIDAYRARRALDYLVGYTLSPVLWRKLPGSRSAGRVQSVALRLICEREAEIEAFDPQEYWTIDALLQTPRAENFKARLSHFGGKKLGKFDLANEAQAKAAVAAIVQSKLRVVEVERKQVGRNPSPPFSTSTLQQEASRKLGFSADRTMKTAQRLFEGINVGGETVGLITYMRTDSVQISMDAVNACRRMVSKRYGDNFVPDKPRLFKTRTKNAQEAHEAVRPTDLFRAPETLAKTLGGDEARLYDLIWRRTLASQMAAARMNRVGIDIEGPEGRVMLRATGQTIAFEGFLKVYREGRDEAPDDDDDEGRILPEMARGEDLRQETVDAAQHYTEPPPRFTEASLVKRLEELGIGRPSTYANIISVLQNRNYVQLEQKRFVPEDRGRIVTAFLSDFFDRYVKPDFTADLEGKLDSVAGGDLRWKDVLREFWDPFYERTVEVKERRTTEVIEALNTALARKLFPPRPDGADARTCPLCEDGSLSLKLGRFGAFVGCSNYPRCRYTRQLGEGADDGQSALNRDR
ncbi:MAG: type I DNA topoisomerase, partial [Pseudomonadota bacterium]